MPQRLFHQTLVLPTLAMALFLAGYVCIAFGQAAIGDLLYSVAAKVLLVGLAIISACGLLHIIVIAARDLTQFFSRERSVTRRLATLQVTQHNTRLRSFFEKQQLHYRLALRRDRLLRADAKRQSRQLFKIVDRELRAAQQLLPVARYRSLRNMLVEQKRRHDVGGLLAVREQLNRFH